MTFKLDWPKLGLRKKPCGLKKLGEEPVTGPRTPCWPVLIIPQKTTGNTNTWVLIDEFMICIFKNLHKLNFWFPNHIINHWNWPVTLKLFAYFLSLQMSVFPLYFIFNLWFFFVKVVQLFKSFPMVYSLTIFGKTVFQSYVTGGLKSAIWFFCSSWNYAPTPWVHVFFTS